MTKHRILAIAALLIPACAPPIADDGFEDEAFLEDSLTAAQAASFTYYDFIANAPSAFWHNNDGQVPWGIADTRGTALITSGVLEDGSRQNYLYTHPKWTPDGFMHAAYTVAIPARVRRPMLHASFGFVKGASCTDGVTFGVTTNIDGQWVTLFSKRKRPNGTIAEVKADLSPYAGRTLSLYLVADAGPTSHCDWGAWTGLRILTNSLRYMGPYDNGEGPGVIAESNGFSNLIWLSVCDPRKADPVKCPARMQATYDAIRANPKASVLLSGGGWVWGDNFQNNFATVRGYYDAIIPTIPPDIRSRIVAAATADEPYLDRLNRQDEIRTKLEKLNNYFHTALPGVATFLNFSYVELDNNVSFPAGTDWFGFDCYLWMGGCGNMGTVENYVGLLESRTGVNKRLVLIPQAHRHKAGDNVGAIQAGLESYYDIARRHRRVIALMPFSRKSYAGVIGYGNGDPASNAIRDKMAEIGRRIIAQ